MGGARLQSLPSFGTPGAVRQPLAACFQAANSGGRKRVTRELALMNGRQLGDEHLAQAVHAIQFVNAKHTVGKIAEGTSTKDSGMKLHWIRGRLAASRATR
jgi:hypothetical protein